MSQTITLKTVIHHAGQDYLAIEIDEPTVGGIEVFEEAVKNGSSDTAATIAMLAFDTGVPVEVIRKIKTSDFVKISEALAPFVKAAAPDTGDTGDQSQPTLPTSSTTAPPI